MMLLAFGTRLARGVVGFLRPAWSRTCWLSAPGLLTVLLAFGARLVSISNRMSDVKQSVRCETNGPMLRQFIHKMKNCVIYRGRLHLPVFVVLLYVGLFLQKSTRKLLT